MSVGRAEYKFGYKYQFNQSSKRITKVTVECNLQLYMPIWTKVRTAERAERIEWARFWKALLYVERKPKVCPACNFAFLT